MASPSKAASRTSVSVGPSPNVRRTRTHGDSKKPRPCTGQSRRGGVREREEEGEWEEGGWERSCDVYVCECMYVCACVVGVRALSTMRSPGMPSTGLISFTTGGLAHTITQHTRGQVSGRPMNGPPLSRPMIPSQHIYTFINILHVCINSSSVSFFMWIAPVVGVAERLSREGEAVEREAEGHGHQAHRYQGVGGRGGVQRGGQGRGRHLQAAHLL